MSATHVVDFFGEMYTDTEICLPEIEIDGTTTLVLSHRGVMVCIEPVCDILSGAFDAADAGTA